MSNLPVRYGVGREFNVLALQLLVHLVHGGTALRILTPSRGDQFRHILVQDLFNARPLSVVEDIFLQHGIRIAHEWLRECQHFPHEHAD